MKYEIEIPSVVNPNEEFSVAPSRSGASNVFVIEQKGRYYITTLEPIPSEPEKDGMIPVAKLRQQISHLETRVAELERWKVKEETPYAMRFKVKAGRDGDMTESTIEKVFNKPTEAEPLVTMDENGNVTLHLSQQELEQLKSISIKSEAELPEERLPQSIRLETKEFSFIDAKESFNAGRNKVTYTNISL